MITAADLIRGRTSITIGECRELALALKTARLCGSEGRPVMQFTLGDLVYAVTDTPETCNLRRFIGYSVSGDAVSVYVRDGRRPEIHVCDEAELVLAVLPAAAPVVQSVPEPEPEPEPAPLPAPDTLAAARRWRNLTQKQLATLVGCGLQTVRLVEQGRRTPSRMMYARLEQALGVELRSVK